MARGGEADELARLRADILSLVLQEAGREVARNPESFVNSRFMDAARKAAAQTVEERLRQSPPPTAEDLADQVVALIRDEISALAQGQANEAGGRGAVARARAGQTAKKGFLPRVEENKPFWGAAVVALLLLTGFAAFTAGAAFEQAGVRARDRAERLAIENRPERIPADSAAPQTAPIEPAVPGAQPK